MARTKKSKGKLNTDLDDTKAMDDVQDDYSAREEGYSDDSKMADEEQSDDVTYTMGDIQVMDSGEAEDEEFKKASENLTKDTDEDGEEDEWLDEEYNYKDEDPFLDMDEDYDMDNPYENEE